MRAGLKADINIIDLDHLQSEPPHMERDLPAGGQRLLQGARGYEATIVSGEVVMEVWVGCVVNGLVECVVAGEAAKRKRRRTVRRIDAIFTIKVRKKGR